MEVIGGLLLSVLGWLPSKPSNIGEDSMNVIETIQRPWKQPMAYTELVFWFVIFVIAAYAMFDGMRIAASFIKNSADAAIS